MVRLKSCTTLVKVVHLGVADNDKSLVRIMTVGSVDRRATIHIEMPSDELVPETETSTDPYLGSVEVSAVRCFSNMTFYDVTFRDSFGSSVRMSDFVERLSSLLTTPNAVWRVSLKNSKNFTGFKDGDLW